MNVRMTKLDMAVLTAQWDAPLSIRTRVTTRNGGVSMTPYSSLNLGDHVGDLPENVFTNRAIIRKALPNEPIWLKQVHGTQVSTPSNRLIEADAIVSNVANEVLAIMTADCLPVLFTNTSGTEVGAAHAGWRGLCAGVLENTVKEMRNLHLHGSENILAWLGPAIGPEVFEVGQDVVDAFDDFGVNYPQEAFTPIAQKPGKYLANIYMLARSRLQAAGVGQIYGGQFCTVSQSDQFFSYRRDGVTGRFVSLIWIADGN
ncbi:peptidoglycan editing factor PgeF [Polynucleobacter sp. MWH-Post4-6-1]|nr:peptidoglycan editing factor PgeF [Polynucleobacter sp. MWH-Post4-6-1]